MNHRLRSLAAATVAGLVTALIVVAPVYLNDDQPSDSRVTELPEAAGPTSPLDAYPGFGKSPRAMLRDDAIALWEAFLRDELMGECMAEAGFDYAPDGGEHTFRERAARYLGVASEVGDPPKADTPPTGDKYWLRLYGVTEEEALAGRGDVEGGCSGKAWASIPGVWQLKRELSDEQATLYVRTNDSPALDRPRKDFESCARGIGVPDAADPAALEANASSPELLSEVAHRCIPEFERSKAAVQSDLEGEFISTHPEFKVQLQHYSGVEERMRSDIAFTEFLLGK